MTYETYPGSLYDYTAGVYCGVLVKEHVMRKLASLQTKHLEEVKRLLTNEADLGNVFPSMWTLHYPGGEQTTVIFISKDDDVYQRIKNATTAAQPRHIPVVFIASSMEEAKKMADERYSKLEQGEKHDIQD